MTLTDLVLILVLLCVVGAVFHLISRIAFGVSKAMFLIVLCLAIFDQYNANADSALSSWENGGIVGIEAQIQAFSEKQFFSKVFDNWGEHFQAINAFAHSYFKEPAV